MKRFQKAEALIFNNRTGREFIGQAARRKAEECSAPLREVAQIWSLAGEACQVTVGFREGKRIEIVILSPDQIGTKNLALKFPRDNLARHFAQDDMWRALGNFLLPLPSKDF